MKNRSLSVILLFFFCICGKIHAQMLDSLLDAYDKKNPREKIHVHFDNSLYTPGQTIWYKAYLIKDIEPSGLSKNLYIDWADETGKLITRTVNPINSATASGNFLIPKKYSGTRLQVMAYTKWMLNNDSAFLFHEVLQIAQPAVYSNIRSAVASVATLAFFPEGGDMVENISGNIAFKALNSAGLPVSVAGTIQNKNKQVVAKFYTEHDGMGKLLFTPLPDETYTAEWKDPQGTLRYTKLPAAKKSGIILNLQNESAIRLFTIERSSLVEERFKKITIVGSMNQQVVFKAAIDLSQKNKVSATIPAVDLPSGVLQLTVFDNNRQPVTERILFVNNEEYLLPAEIHTDTFNLEKRGRNVYRIELSDPAYASLSLSVTEGDGVYDSSRNIISQLLLSSEIKGRIHNPAYYFSSPEDSIAHHLDLVMLTNGWRRFAWTDILAGKMPVLKYAQDSNYFSLVGRITRLSEQQKKNMQSVNLILVSKDSTRQLISSPLRADGSFREDDLMLYDTTTVLYKTNNVVIPSRSNISITNGFVPFDPQRTTNPLLTYLPDTTGMDHIKMIADKERALDSLMRQTTLKDVVVETKAKIKTRIEEIDERYATGIFRGGNSQMINVVDDPNAQHSSEILDYLRARLPRGGIQRFTGFVPLPISYFLDEIPADSTDLKRLTMDEVAYVKVFTGSFVGASMNGGGGVVAVYRKKGGDNKEEFKGLDHILLPGYTPVKEFYSPDYAETQINFSQTDIRRTLYWKPNIETDNVNKFVSISFYNNDISHSLQVVLEGITLDGKLIHVSKRLK